jgi:hypothetical protein
MIPTNYRTLLDRPPTHNIKNFDRMVVELGKYMNEIEMDLCLDFMNTVADSKWDINPSTEDCKTQLQIMLGKDRVNEMIMKWSMENQNLLTVFGKLKYKRNSDGYIFDGLDPGDNPYEYTKVYL